MIGSRVYIDPTAVLIGDVCIGDGVSIWPYAVLRGDAESIAVGEGSNIQEHSVLHVGKGFPTVIGRDVTVGHGVIINGASIGDHCIIGMNATIVEGAVIGSECIIGANAVVTGKMVVPPRSVVLGVPGKVAKTNVEGIKERAEENAQAYHRLRDEYLAGKYQRHLIPRP